ncbi:vacuolar sorting-associated protein [Eremomyces bilateralis CBS 781.70]|uniref:Vacuolar protein sorting-associated protein 17 n=1 Tax=Eremomyces bilateralis CBS 781.70 TaxID=1392243 RepID=A0A6G1G3I7_9PEZI|nr:vacuolar sorting-associated protein [Eremomyces bilateralis CBS 781.70]KAF1812624.1 vacuolar sorting-associated protein [Eremomyces bilateralis CBS 781.70]
MDYSSIGQDPDHPAEGSPWATSPQHNKTEFGAPSAADVPSAPLPPSPYNADDDTHPGLPQSPFRGGANGQHQRQDSDDLGASGMTDSGHGVPTPSTAPRAEQHFHGGDIATTEQQRPQSSRARPSAPHYKLQAKITGLERTSKKDPILKFDVYTNLPKFRTTQFRDVRRTHSEFVKLAEHLISANPEALVPAVPTSVTSAGVGTDEDEVRIKTAIQRWLNTVCSNEVLKRDEEMVFFVESDFGYSPVVRRKQPATGVRRKMLKQFAPPPDDTPELAEARPVVKLFYLGTMDASQKLERVVKARRALGLAEAELGVKMAQMHAQEIHQGLSNAYKKLGRIIQMAGDFHAAQGTSEATTLGDPLAYHSSDAFIVKETLTNRHILLRELLQAQQSARAKTTAADRLRSSSSVRRDKVDEAIAALDEALSHETHLGQKAQRVTANLVQERRKWFTRTAADMRQSIREYVVRQIEAERRTLATLETVRPDIRAIDASGGLSRLGREAHPSQRRVSLASSQGPKGDAWSGVPRRQDGLNRSVSGGFVHPVPEEDEAAEATPKGKHGSKDSVDEADQDRVDARNAASRLATML